MLQAQIQTNGNLSRNLLADTFAGVTNWLRQRTAFDNRYRDSQDTYAQPRVQTPQDAYILRKRELPNRFTQQDWHTALDYWGHKCAVCERPRGLWHTLSHDHWIPLSSEECPGTDPTNILPLCCGVDGCNNSKGKQMPDEWLRKKLGKRRANRKLAEIEAYFDWVRDLHAPRLGCPECGGAVTWLEDWRMWRCPDCDLGWDRRDARTYENCPKCQCWMLNTDGTYLCPRCNLEWDHENLPTCEACPNCRVGTLRWVYKLGQKAGNWRCSHCRVEWMFE